MDLLRRGWEMIAVVTIALPVTWVWPVAAADTPLVKPVMAAVAAPVPYDWTGFYAGLFAGGAFDSHVRAGQPLKPQSPICPTTPLNPKCAYNPLGRDWSYHLDSSAIGGGQVGYNYQFTPPFSSIVLGVENETGYLSQKGARDDPTGPGNDTHGRTKLGSWFDVLAGRFGVAANRALFYIKGGVAFTRVSSKIDDNCIISPCGGATLHESGSKSITTGAVGGGLEYALADHWTVKAEYLFIDLDETYHFSAVAGGQISQFRFRFSSQHRVEGLHTAKLGLNFKF